MQSILFIAFKLISLLIILKMKKNLKIKFLLLNKKKIKKKNYNKSLPISKKKKINISISYSTDNKYIYPTIVSITSLVNSSGIKTFYNVYILHPHDFTKKSKKFLKNVEKKYPDKIYIKYINMRNKYKNLQLNYRLTTPAYYRLSLQDILPHEKRIIYLDGDTLVYEDLNELFNLEMKGNVIMGFLDNAPNALKSFGINNATVLCSGVLLIDLDGLRKYDYSKKIKDFISKNKKRLKQHDQTIINVVMQDRISPLPPKYGIWAGLNKSNAKKYLNLQLKKLKYNEEEFFKALEHPAIVHYTLDKPFWRKYSHFYNDWWDIARKTGYYNEIYIKSPKPRKKAYT